jgi:hypothetical protein
MAWLLGMAVLGSRMRTMSIGCDHEIFKFEVEGGELVWKWSNCGGLERTGNHDFVSIRAVAGMNDRPDQRRDRASRNGQRAIMESGHARSQCQVKHVVSRVSLCFLLQKHTTKVLYMFVCFALANGSAFSRLSQSQFNSTEHAKRIDLVCVEIT